jgi:hypothetical protein
MRMFENFTNVSGLNSQESREYRALKAQIGALLSEELILSRCTEWTKSRSVIEALLAHRDERIVRAGIPLSTGEIVATHSKLSEMVRAGYLEEKTVLQLLDETQFEARFVRTAPLGRERLSLVRVQIEELAKPFTTLDERHIAAAVPAPHWWQMLTTLFGK